jgi:hypothetical protein
LVGAAIYGYTAIATPHDTNIYNETVCSGYCPTPASYFVAFGPMRNGTTYYDNATIRCSNNSGAQPLYRLNINSTTSYGLIPGNSDAGLRKINLTYSNGATPAAQFNYRDVKCDYIWDWATDDQQGFFDTNISNTGAGFGLLAVIGIVLAAVAIITIVALLKGG